MTPELRDLIERLLREINDRATSGLLSRETLKLATLVEQKLSETPR